MMMDNARGSALLFAIFATLVLTTMAAGPGDEDDGPLHRIQYEFSPGTVNYYVIENEYREKTTITSQFSLSLSTVVKDRRSIIQRTLSPTTRAASRPVTSGPARLSWTCDRYEIHETSRSIGPKIETKYDSLRDSYPPAGFRELGKLPGSVVTFTVSPTDGRAQKINLVPGKVAGPVTRKKLSRTAKKCSLTVKNTENLLHLLGPYYLPDGPKRIGDQWTRTQTDTFDTFGTAITTLTCTLEGVRELDGRRIATIDLLGDVRLQQKSTPSGKRTTSGATSKPVGRRKKPSKEREFDLEKVVCAGSVEFDVTRGRLVRMTLRRELAGAAKLKSNKSDKKTTAGVSATTSHVFRLVVTDTPPPKPVIVGGPKPPPIAPEDIVAAKKSPPRSRSRGKSRPGATSRPGRRRATSGRGVTSRPADGKRATNQAIPPRPARGKAAQDRGRRRSGATKGTITQPRRPASRHRTGVKGATARPPNRGATSRPSVRRTPAGRPRPTTRPSRHRAGVRPRGGATSRPATQPK